MNLKLVAGFGCFMKMFAEFSAQNFLLLEKVSIQTNALEKNSLGDTFGTFSVLFFSVVANF